MSLETDTGNLRADTGAINATLAGITNGTQDQVVSTNSSGQLVSGSGFYSSVLFQSHIPFIIPPSGTMGNNGAMTAVATLPATYVSCYMYFAAGVIASGSAAGWYYAVMSSATAGTAYNNTYTSGQPTIPASPTAFATTGPGAWTGAVTSQNMQQYSVPAGTMGLRDTLRVSVRWSFAGTANNKICQVNFGGSTAAQLTQSTSGQVTTILIYEISNRDNVAIQIAGSTSGYVGLAGGNFNILAVNTANAAIVAMMGQHTTATDYIICESIVVELIKGS
jgi:hypothetical protein